MLPRVVDYVGRARHRQTLADTREYQLEVKYGCRRQTTAWMLNRHMKVHCFRDLSGIFQRSRCSGHPGFHNGTLELNLTTGCSGRLQQVAVVGCKWVQVALVGCAKNHCKLYLITRTWWSWYSGAYSFFVQQCFQWGWSFRALGTGLQCYSTTCSCISLLHEVLLLF